ncbi:HAMP domain-containing protein [Candidatus Bathyarchaeota archaeon]|nr:HAMP domain-containing protein [Candidatus Bathyarchaeota archaeon]
MKIKNQLLLTIVALAIILTIIVGTIFFTNNRANQASSLQITAADIDRKVNELSQISNDYFLFQNDSQLIAWQTAVNGILVDISNFNAMNSQQVKILSTIQSDLAPADNAFNKTTIYFQNTPRDISLRTNPQFQAVWNQLTQSILRLSDDVDDLTQVLHNETVQGQSANIDLFVIMLLAFSGFALIVYSISYRRTLKSVAELQNGLRIIGRGNLDYSVKIRSQDEIGELSESVNKMTIQLRDLTKNLQIQERMAAIGQTAGMVGHDIRNPLQAMVSDIYLIKDEIASNPNYETKKELIESLDSLDENIGYVNKIVQDLQDYARPISPEYSEANLSNVLVKIFENVRVPDTVKLSVKIKGLDEFRTDKMLLQRALSNLVTNAIQAMPNGGLLEITGHRQENRAVITVSDTGVGIPEEIKPKLFTPMVTTKAKGQGFGLAASKRLIEAMEGTVTFESGKGKGTKFIVELPITG